MYTHITHGSAYYMEQLKEKHPNRDFLQFDSQEDVVLYEETNQSTVFQSNVSYKVIEYVGYLSSKHPMLLYYFKINDGSETSVTSQLTTSHKDFEKYEGFRSYRLLEPTTATSFVAAFQFENFEQINNFKSSKLYRETFEAPIKAHAPADMMTQLNYTKILHPSEHKHLLDEE